MKQHPGYDLVALFNRGEEKAFRGLYDELYPSVLVLAGNMVSNTQEAQDICTESFVKLFQTEQKFESLQNLKAFLFRITKNACLDSLRKVQRHTLRQKQLRYLMEQKEDFFKNEVEAELVALIHASIENLPKKCRKIFKLTMMDFSYEEIAVHLNITVSTVRNQKARGLKLLRIALLKENELSRTVAIVSLLVAMLCQKPLN